MHDVLVAHATGTTLTPNMLHWLYWLANMLLRMASE